MRTAAWAAKPDFCFRGSYTGTDPIGIELAGALKNIYAIAAGMSDGLGYENNTRASG
jgi:glycerol-3-phosphate dehydrogenase